MNLQTIFFRSLFVMAGWFLAPAVQASDSIPLFVSGREFKAGDTVYFSWKGQSINKDYPMATLHLWIDNLENGRRWKLRYPILNGEAEGALVVAQDLEPGTYAFNFLGAEHFLEISGKVRKVKVKTALNYETKKNDTITITDLPGPIKYNIGVAMLNRQGLLYDEDLKPSGDGSFRIPPIVFGDTATLVFNTDQRETYLFEMRTPLDTAFVPFYSKTVFVTVKGQQPVEKVDTSAYRFDFSNPYQNSITLQEVIVTGPSKAQQFEKEHVSPLFKDINSKTLNCLDNDQLLRTNNIWIYIQSQIPGIMFKTNGLTRSAFWRGSPVTFFVDELQMDINNITVQPMDVALIKVYPPPNGISGRAPGGVIGIYTKRGDQYEGPPSPYTYRVKGYTQGEILWQ
jgi:hypothetical protein